MFYYPLNYDAINVMAGTYNPSPVKAYNNETFAFWERALFQRAASRVRFNLPEDWNGSIYDFFKYCMFRFGFAQSRIKNTLYRFDSEPRHIIKVFAEPAVDERTL